MSSDISILLIFKLPKRESYFVPVTSYISYIITRYCFLIINTIFLLHLLKTLIITNNEYENCADTKNL